MRARSGRALVLLAASLAIHWCGTNRAGATPPAPAGDPAFWDAYWRGLMQMRAADFRGAAASFTDANRRDGAHPSPLLARGAVRTLLGDFEGARDDLSRCRMPASREPLLWSHAVDAMTNSASGGRGIPVPRSLQRPGAPTATFSGVPGHLVQGGEDYPTSYASAVVYELAMPVYEAVAAGRSPDAGRTDAARRNVGRWFANRMLATRETVSRTFAEAQRRLGAGDLQEARALLDLARSVFPFDAEMALESGDVWLRAGRPATARADYTVAATMRTDLAAAYAGRAEAAARMGDAARALADVGHAKTYGNGEPPGLRERVDAALAEGSVDDSPAALLERLDDAGRAGADLEAMLPLAEALHRAADARRVRYDEGYQETLRTYEDRIRADPRAVPPRVALAQYLHDESDLRGEEVEPRRGKAPFRFQFTARMELDRALHHVEAALRVEPDHVGALVTRAYVLDGLGRTDEAERSIDRAMELAGPTNASAIGLLAKYRKRQVGNLLMQAMGLRMPTYTTTTHHETRSDGVWRVETTTRHDPSDGDLARADALERQARELMERTKALMEAGIAATKGTLDGLLLEASYEDWFGSRNDALRLLGRAVEEHPKALEAHDALIDYLRFLGQHDTAIRQEAASWPLFQTTCAPLLRLAWRDVPQKGWAAAVKDLERARRLDPTDARATAYLAIARADAREEDEALALLRVAAALERARLARDDRGAARAWPRPAGDLANAMQIHQDLALALAAAGRAAEALRHDVESGDLALRFPPDGVAAKMFSAMRPDANASAGPAQEPPNGATLASRAHLGAAKALKAMGRAAEAERHFQAAARHVRPHDSSVPNVGDGRGDDNFSGYAEGASATALLELAKGDIEKKRWSDAFRKLQDATQAQPTRDERQEINALILSILPHLDEAARNPPAGASGGPRGGPAAALIEQAKQQIARRDYRAANLSLNRAAQSGADAAQRREIEELLLRIAREQR